MSQFFSDDIDALLRENHGDTERLKRIKADFEAKKLVTIEDRKYVEGLVSRYLSKKSEPQIENIIKTQKRIVPPPPPPQQASFELKYRQKPKEPIPKLRSQRTKSVKILIVVFVAVAAIAVAGILAINQKPGVIVETPTQKTLETDAQSYSRGDIVSISGKIKPNSQVHLLISNPDGDQIWTETLNAKNDGTFSTLVIAGGDGWEKNGKYSIKADHDGTTDTVTFELSD